MCERGTKNERGILIRRCLSTFVGWHRSPREMSRNRMCVNDHFRPREIQIFTRFRVWLNTKDLLTGTLGGQFPCKIEQVPILTHKTGIGSNAADATWNKSRRQHEILTPHTITITKIKNLLNTVSVDFSESNGVCVALTSCAHTSERWWSVVVFVSYKQV
jgi:hypothetical protein